METDIFVYRMADVIYGLYMRYNCWDMNAFKSIDELLRVLEREGPAETDVPEKALHFLEARLRPRTYGV